MMTCGALAWPFNGHRGNSNRFYNNPVRAPYTGYRPSSGKRIFGRIPGRPNVKTTAAVDVDRDKILDRKGVDHNRTLNERHTRKPGLVREKPLVAAKDAGATAFPCPDTLRRRREIYNTTINRHTRRPCNHKDQAATGIQNLVLAPCGFAHSNSVPLRC